jgi:PAS domain S-box-containing protein
MYASTAFADSVVQRAVEAAKQGPKGLFAALERLQAPIYVTDADGVIRYFNPACVGFSGRTPTVGKDRWCVTWKLYTEDGAFLPHDQCPMAMSLQNRQPVRGITAVAERPDGTRVNFVPFPTPLFGGGGELLGAVNMLIDVTDIRQVAELRGQACKCERLARHVGDPDAARTLSLMAAEYDAKAIETERACPARLYVAV